jgi:hypothetical protein
MRIHYRTLGSAFSALWIIGVSNKLDVWLVENSGGTFDMRERIAWEGMKEAHQPWSHIHFKDWRSNG